MLVCQQSSGGLVVAVLIASFMMRAMVEEEMQKVAWSSTLTDNKQHRLIPSGNHTIHNLQLLDQHTHALPSCSHRVYTSGCINTC